MELKNEIVEENVEEGITLKHIWDLLVLKKFLILVITVIITIVGVVFTFNFTTAQYESKGDVIVQYQGTDDSTNDYTNLNTSSKIISTLTDLSTKDAVLKKIVEKVQVDMLTMDAAKNDLESYDETKEIADVLTVSYESSSYFIDFVAETPYDELSQSIVQAAMESLIEVTNSKDYEMFNNTVVITDDAVDGYYSSPNKQLYITISVLLGLIIAVLAVFLLDIFRTTLRTKEEIKQFTNLNVLAYFFDNDEFNDENTAFLDSDNPAQESYNKLVTNIKFASPDNPYKVIHFTSSVMSEGKSTTVIHSARTVVQYGKTAVVVDFDLRRPSVHKNFALEKANGLVEYVYENMPLEKIIKHDTESGIDIISVGKKMDNPSVLLQSSKIKDLIAELKEKYDYVFLDTPPVLVASDALNIATYSDCTIFITRANETKKQEIKESLSELSNAKANIIGVVPTHLKQESNENYYYHSYAYKTNEDE